MAQTPKLKDMAKTSAEMAEGSFPGMSVANESIYPYGLCLCLCDDELQKLGINPEEAEVGDFIHLFAMAKLTSKSENDTGSGPKHRLELQITHLGLEGEDAEDEASVKRKIGPKNLYKK